MQFSCHEKDSLTPIVGKRHSLMLLDIHSCEGERVFIPVKGKGYSFISRKVHSFLSKQNGIHSCQWKGNSFLSKEKGIHSYQWKRAFIPVNGEG